MLLHVLQSVEKETDRCSNVLCFFLLASCFIITIVKFKIKIMTYKEANNISIKDYLNSLGIQPVTEKGSYGMYRSPLRETTRQVSRWIITPIYGVTTELVRAGRSSTL